ncbi:DUF4255 domain-containing protein [Polaribacter sp.]|uniref:DUF4255 domain-containing protein n=1 Tax=Polaribacter sp. TaxID=1920175 RepID=UPI003EF5296C
MIFEVLQVIKEEINSYLVTNLVILENIANIDQDGDTETNGVVLTLLNTQEEATLKNVSNHTINGTDVSYKNPKINLNLYLLFSANNSAYKESLKSLSKVIEFFQGKRVFTQANTNFKREGDMLNIKNFRFIVDLYTPSFEELNFIWGTLGGKQYPSAIYKVSLIEIERETILKKGALITGLGTNLNNN